MLNFKFIQGFKTRKDINFFDLRWRLIRKMKMSFHEAEDKCRTVTYEEAQEIIRITSRENE